MIDESHVSINLFLRSVGIRNPFEDDDISQYSGSRASQSQRGERSRGGRIPEVNGGHDVMVPPENSEDRQGTMFAGSAALALTLTGNCAVVAPYAFQKCGIVWGTILFGLMTFSTERVLHMLCICARKTGSNSYGTVARSCLGGYRAHFQTSFLEIGVLLCLIVHYLTILGELTELWLQSFKGLVSISQTWMLLLLLLVMIPLLIPMQYHTLGHVWTVGLASIVVFAMSVFAVAILHFHEHDSQQSAMTDGSSSDPSPTHHRTIWDVIDGFQSLLIAFMASFNVLPIQAALEDPTRERMEKVVHQGVIIGASLTYLVGVVGYLCILASPDASVLDALQYHAANQDSAVQRFALVVYRLCHTSAVLSILIAFPLIITPCRYSILELIEYIYAERQCPELSDCQEDCDTCTTRASTVTEQQNRNNALVVVHNDHVVPPSETSTLLPSIEENPTYDLLSNPVAKVLCTLGILLWAYLGAVVIPLLDAFYTWVGPLLVYIFAYILPSMYFLGIQRPRRGDAEKKTARLFARILIFFCISGMVFSVVYIVAHLPTRQSA